MLEKCKGAYAFYHYGEKVIALTTSITHESDILKIYSSDGCKVTPLPIANLARWENLYKIEETNGAVSYLFLYFIEDHEGIMACELSKIPEDLSLENLVFDWEGQSKGKKPMDIPTRCKAVYKWAYHKAYDRIRLRRMTEKETKVYQEILLQERKKFEDTLTEEQKKGDILDILLLDNSNNIADSKIHDLIAAKYLYKMGYDADYFRNNDTHDIYPDRLKNMIEALENVFLVM